MTNTDTTSTHYLNWSHVGRASGARYTAGALLILLAWAAGTLAPGILRAATGIDPQTSAATGLAYLLSTFALAFLAVPLTVQVLHRRPGWSAALPRPIGPIRDLGRGVGIALVSLLAVDLLCSLWDPVTFVGVDLRRWLPLAAVAAVGFGIQAGFEELFFRGYLMQFTHRSTKSPVLMVGLPALAFAAMHWGNLTQFGNNPLQLAPYLLLGSTLGWAAWRSGSLWLPFGMHWTNNTYGVLLLGNKGDVLPGGAPFARDLTGITGPGLLTLATLLCVIQVALIERATASRGPHVSRAPNSPACSSLSQTRTASEQRTRTRTPMASKIPTRLPWVTVGPAPTGPIPRKAISFAATAGL
jgi:CAAX protease family protein